jgi:Icc-related predicted phosphoesterase
MRILAIADYEETYLSDRFDRSRVEGVDLVISCGDLDPGYLEFVESMLNVPLLYVRGNHDGVYDQRPPLGCRDIDGEVYDFHGLRVMGLGGSLRYKEGPDMYTEEDMAWRVIRARFQAKLHGGVDVIATHAPARGWGDLDDYPHRGFECFNPMLDGIAPRYLLHGHVHMGYGRIEREHVHPSGTRILNVCGSQIVDV